MEHKQLMVNIKIQEHKTVEVVSISILVRYGKSCASVLW